MDFTTKDRLESEFALKFLRFINAFNYLDRNVGLCLSFMLDPKNPEATYNLLSRLTAQRKLEALRKALTDRFRIKYEGVISEFEDWYESAEASRAIRNKYVHGQWEMLPMKREKPVQFSLPAWIDGGNYSLSLEEFENIVQEVESVLNELITFRRRHSI